MGANNDKGFFGEQGAGFFLGARGYILVDGPSGAGGHAANAPGFDGVAYHRQLDDLIIYDNKSFKSDANVRGGTAIDPARNLTQNLDAFIVKVAGIADLPSKDRIQELLRATRAGISGTNVRVPPNVRIAITNYAGNSPGITTTFAGRGITFIDIQSAPSVPAQPRRVYLTRSSIQQLAQPVDAGVAAYDARRARVNAKAEGARAGAQWANDYALKRAIDQEMDRLAPEILEAMTGGGAALVVINIDSRSPPGNVGMVTARNVNSAYVIARDDKDRDAAVRYFQNRPALRSTPTASGGVEPRLLWFAAPDVE